MTGWYEARVGAEGETSMGYSIRRVEPGFVHPVDEYGKALPAHYDGYESALAAWLAERAAWPGSEEFTRYGGCTYEEYAGNAPVPARYMWYGPKPPLAARTCFVLYCTISEGKPETPACASVEDLARWLSVHGMYSGHWGPDTYESYLAAMMTHFEGGVDRE